MKKPTRRATIQIELTWAQVMALRDIVGEGYYASDWTSEDGEAVITPEMTSAVEAFDTAIEDAFEIRFEQRLIGDCPRGHRRRSK